jgi:hypothetical protein
MARGVLLGRRIGQLKAASGGVADPYINADFVAGTYSLNGSASTIGALFEADTDFSGAGFSASPGVDGLAITQYDFPRIKSTLSDFIAAPFTVVVEWTPSADPNSALTVNEYEGAGALDSYWESGLFGPTPGSFFSWAYPVEDGVGSTETIDMPEGATIKMASRFTGTALATAVNGTEVISYSPADHAQLRDSLAFRGNATIRSIKIYLRAFNDAEMLAVTALAPVAPVNVVAPVISGTATTGSTLTVAPGTWTGSPTPTYAYQWKHNGIAIGGETGLTYVLQVADEGADITCDETATNSAGSATETSNVITPSAATSLTAPVLVWDGITSSDPPQFQATLTDAQVGDVITLEWDDNSSFTSPSSATNTIDSGEAAANEVGFTTGTWGDGTWYARVKHSRGGSDSSWSNTETVTVTSSFALDLFIEDITLNNPGNTGYSMRIAVPITVPYGGITSLRAKFRAGITGTGWVSDHVSVGVQNTGANTLATPLEITVGGSVGFNAAAGEIVTTDEIALTLTAGAKVLIFVFDCGTPADIAWSNTGTQDNMAYYKSGTDSYNQATVTGFGSLTCGGFGVTEIEMLTASEVTTLGPVTMTTNSAGDTNATFRVKTPPISVGGSEIRVKFKANYGQQSNYDNLAIGIANGTDGNTTAIPTELLASGVSGMSFTPNEERWSDWTPFVTAPGDQLVVVIDMAATFGNSTYTNSATGATNYYKASTNSYNQATVAGMSPAANQLLGFTEIQVR